MGDETTTIRIKRGTKEEFEKLGVYGESADDILQRLIKKAEKGGE